MKKRGFGAGRWNGVGGKLDEGETIEEAMIRETREEIGVTPTSFEKVGYMEFNEYFKGEPAIMKVHVYQSEVWDGEPSETEEMKPKWFNHDELPLDEMWPDDEYWLPVVMAGGKVVAHFELDENDSIISHDVRRVESLPA